MNKSTLSITYLIISFILISSGLVFGASQVIAYFYTGANIENIYLVDTKSVNEYHQPKIEWQPVANEGRKMEKRTLGKIADDYIASYFHIQQVLRTGETQGVEDYFTDTAREYVYKLVDYHQKSGQSSRGTTISHEARLDFYSTDGTILTLTDRVVSFKKMSVDDQYITFYDTSEYQAMLILEDNFWRIRHLVKGDYFDDSIHPIDRLNPDSLFSQLPMSFKIKCLNYYPMEYPWTEMWGAYDKIDFPTDFKKISTLGFNTLRVFVPFEEFGAVDVDQKQLANLMALLDLAEAHDLKVIVTLFDFFRGYHIEEWTLSDRHAETIVNRIKEHPALLAWDAKNEPDLDFEEFGEDTVVDWLHFIVSRIRMYDPKTPITIGWSQPEAMETLDSEVDFLSFHYYRAPEDLFPILDFMNPDKPLFIGETGAHSFSALWYPYRQDEAYQLNYYKEIGKVIDNNNLHYAFWTLYDFKKIPPNVAGKWPWQKGPQKSYGIIDSKGNQKPIYEWVKKFNQKKDAK